MKKLFLIILFSVSTIVGAQNLISNKLNFRYTPFIEAVCEELGIDDEEFYVLAVCMEPNIHGYTQKTAHGMYIISININSEESIYKTLAHELVHVKQDISGEWDINNPTTIFRGGYYKYISIEAKAIELTTRGCADKLYRKFYRLRY